jgi:hypothetical protein
MGYVTGFEQAAVGTCVGATTWDGWRGWRMTSMTDWDHQYEIEEDRCEYAQHRWPPLNERCSAQATIRRCHEVLTPTRQGPLSSAAARLWEQIVFGPPPAPGEPTGEEWIKNPGPDRWGLDRSDYEAFRESTWGPTPRDELDAERSRCGRDDDEEEECEEAE